MLVAFIDFSKAYDKVDREKLWSCLQSAGVEGRFLRFLQALYEGSVCKVKVDGQISDDFKVNAGLRQGCVLSPLLFSLYINGVVKKLKEEKCGVVCSTSDEVVPGLLFADDTCLLASDESGLRKSLDVLIEWCKEWGVQINVAKSGVMHVRNKKVKRCNVTYDIDGKTIPMVTSYKYLGCVIDEHLDLKDMIEDRAEAGRRALGACFSRCREEIGDMTVGIARKLMGSLVESTLMYGAEIWGCSRHLEAIEKVQLRALRMFFGVGTLHPKTSLWFEMQMLPLVWEARMRCVRFWLKVLSAKEYEGRLLKKIVSQAVECGKGGWVKNMARCTDDFGWSGMEVDAVRSLSDSEIREMLVSVAWRNVTSVMNKDMEEKPKLRILKEIADLKLESRCALVKKKRERSMLMKLRGGTAAFQVEVGRWRGVKREERICKECQSGEIEDVCHWLLQCPAWDHIRQPLFTAQALKDLPEGATLEQRTAAILSIACSNNCIRRCISSMWYARFEM